MNMAFIHCAGVHAHACKKTQDAGGCADYSGLIEEFFGEMGGGGGDGGNTGLH